MSQNYKPKPVCVICGDKGTGRNFGADTCESCKVFFRRNGLKNKPYICKNNGNCIILINNRSSCKRCRLSKCLAKGMKIGLIKQTDKNKNLDINNNNSTNDSQIISTMLAPVISMAPDYNTFNTYESYRLSHLINAAHVFNYLGSDTDQSRVIQLNDIHDCYRVNFGAKMDRDIGSYVRFAKRLLAFNGIGDTVNDADEDQLLLVRYGCMETLLLRYSVQYDTNTDCWKINSDDNSSSICQLDILKTEPGDFYTKFWNYFHRLIPQWGRDYVIMDLLTAIVLFNPNRPDLKHRNAIKSIQLLYIYLLKRYLLMRYRSQSESQKVLFNLMYTLVNDLTKISEIEIKNATDYYSNYLGPIFKEIANDCYNKYIYQ